MTQAQEQAGSAVGPRAVELLQRLIRFNTVNPPGNEGEAQRFLSGALSAAGWECEILARKPDRPNLVARLRGAEEGPGLALICHVDTVPADPGEWTRDPWGGELVDGYVWGRGALDMKDQVASETAACLALAEAGMEAGPRRSAARCQRRRGDRRPQRGEVAVRASTRRRFAATWSSTRAPGSWSASASKRFYTLAVGEKGVFRFHLRTRGVAGHASLPGVGDNALLKLGPLLESLRRQPPRETTPDTELFLERLLG